MEIDPTVHLTAPFPDIRPVSVIVMLPVRPLGTAIGRNFSLSLTHTHALFVIFLSSGFNHPPAAGMLLLGTVHFTFKVL